MLVIIKSAPHTEGALAGLRLAGETSSDLLLIQNGVYLARQDGLKGISGAVYALEDDLRLRGTGARGEGVKAIGYDESVDLMAKDRVVGMF